MVFSRVDGERVDFRKAGREKENVHTRGLGCEMAGEAAISHPRKNDSPSPNAVRRLGRGWGWGITSLSHGLSYFEKALASDRIAMRDYYCYGIVTIGANYMSELLVVVRD
jgi:hypothetical protein